MLPKGRKRRHKCQEMGSSSKPGPSVNVVVVCMVEAPESQERRQDLGYLLFLLRLIRLNNTKAGYASSRVWLP